MDTIYYLVDVVAVAVFAISGALAAAEKKLDILAFVLFGTLTGIGGGTIRDVLINADAVFWIEHPLYLWTCIIASAATYFLAPIFNSIHKVLLWMDAVGLALFSVLGANKALSFGVPPVVAVAMGMITASGGGLIRDTLLQKPALLLSPEIYVTASLLGGFVFVFLLEFSALLAMDSLSQYAIPIAILAAFTLRASAILFDLRLPKYGRD